MDLPGSQQIQEEAQKIIIRDYAPMDTRADKKKIKQLQKKIDTLERTLSKTEVRPCQGDNDLKKKEEEVKELISEIKILKKKRDKYVYSWK